MSSTGRSRGSLESWNRLEIDDDNDVGVVGEVSLNSLFLFHC